MEELFKLANEYYTKVKSFRGLPLRKKFTFWTLVISAPFFILSMIYFLLESFSGNIHSLFNREFLLVILSEITMLLSLLNIKEWKEDTLIKKLSIELNTSFDSVKSAKAALLEMYFDCSKTSFSEVAIRIEKMLILATKYSGEHSLIERFFNFIYNKEANSRALTLFVIFSSLITALSISAGQNIHTLFHFYSQARWGEIFGLYFTCIFLVLILGYGVIELFKNSKDLLIFLKLHFTPKHSEHIETVKFLINDLNKLHSFKRSKDSKIIIPLGVKN